MHNILALDQASRTSGYAIFKDGELFSHGTFTVTDTDIGDRLYKIRSKVIELIEDYDINEVAFEDIYMDGQRVNNVNTFKILSEVFGVIDELLVERQLPHTAILAGTWKSTCGIKGRSRPEQKKNAQKFVLDTYNIKASQDACDAICIGTHLIRKAETEFNWD